ncbi:MAG: HypC/HybG/HupF family hydrogenase formation chaperone, partial [bacterium]|nr:HypC/HybG/HupF family hydrogenase formation chaperone [bacterium]
PVKVLKIDGKTAEIELGGVKRQARLDMLDDVIVGDYVILHAGFAIQKLDEQDALETLEIWREIIETSERLP